MQTCESCNNCGTTRTMGTHGRAEKNKNAVETIICNHKHGCKREIYNKKSSNTKMVSKGSKSITNQVNVHF